MTNLAELPGVLVVADSYANVWTEERATDFGTGAPVTYRRAKMFVRADGEPHYYRLSMCFAKEVVDALPIDMLADDIGRQAALAMYEVRDRRPEPPDSDPED